MAESRFEQGHLNMAGKEVRGSAASGGDLLLRSTTHATKGDVDIADGALLVNEATDTITAASLAGAGTAPVEATAGGVLQRGTPAAAGAPTNATYWTSQAESGLSAEVNIGALTTGLVKITVATSVATPSTAVPGTDYLVDVAAGTGISLAGTSTKTITSTLRTGLAGGQTIKGGTASGEDLTITSTDHATKGTIDLGSSVLIDETTREVTVDNLSGSEDTLVGVDDDGVLVNVPYQDNNLGNFQFGGLNNVGTSVNLGMYWHNGNNDQSQGEWSFVNPSPEAAQHIRMYAWVFANTLDGNIQIHVTVNGTPSTEFAAFAAGVTGGSGLVECDIIAGPGQRIGCYVVSGDEVTTTGLINLTVSMQLRKEAL